MVKIALDAGHGNETPGKRSPTGEREWSFNNKVVVAAMNKLVEYENVQILRTDDSSGLVDAPLAARTNQANNWKADIFVSVHHNALGPNWGDHEGAETFVYVPMSKNPKSKKLAECVHPRIVKAMQTKDRGIKDANYAVLRNSNMPAILTEGGFMDSRNDIQKMRNDKFLKAQGEAIALGIVEYFDLKPKALPKPVVTTPKSEVKGVSIVEVYKKDASADRSFVEAQKYVKERGISDGTYPHRPVTRQEVWAMIKNSEQSKR